MVVKQLYDTKTGRMLVKGDRVKTFRGEAGTLLHAQEPQHAGSTGRVIIQLDGAQYVSSFFPGVIDAEWRDE
jgi:hypothetical protein